MQLILIKLSSPESPPEFALLGKKQASDRFTPGDWKKVSSLSKGRRVVLLLPDSEVVLTSAFIPSKNKKQLARAIPYALEESLAEDIDELHFTVQNVKHSDENHVAVISKKRLSRYLEKLEKEHISVNFVLPHILTLELHKNCWTLLLNNQHATLRQGEFSGFNCDQHMLDVLLPEQLDKNQPEAIYTNIIADDLPLSLHEISIKNSQDPGLVEYQSIISSLPLNLLSGFIRERTKPKINLKIWKPVMVLSSILATTWIGIFAWQNHQLSLQRDQLETSITRVFKNTFPDGRIVDPPQQMESKLNELTSNLGKTIESPLPLIADVSPLLKKFNDMTLSEVRYQDNELSLVVRAPNLTRLEAFKKEASSDARLDVIIKSSTTTADKVEATLVISSLGKDDQA